MSVGRQIAECGATLMSYVIVADRRLRNAPVARCRVRRRALTSAFMTCPPKDDISGP